MRIYSEYIKSTIKSPEITNQCRLISTAEKTFSYLTMQATIKIRSDTELKRVITVTGIRVMYE